MVAALRDWEQQDTYLEAGSADILSAACQEGYILITYDLRTIPPLFELRGEAHMDRGGMVFIGQHTVPLNN